MDNNNFLKSLSKSLLADVRKVMEAKTHTVPKTEKEKKLAALAEPKDKITHADVLKGRGVAKEEVESIDELSSDTLKSYTNKARPDSYAQGGNPSMKKRFNRIDGVVRAHAKMQGSARVNTNEEAEQIDELSTPTLRKYREKARLDAFDANDVDDERRLRKRSFHHNLAGKKIIKRGDTLRKEEVEELDEAKRTLVGKTSEYKVYHSEDPATGNEDRYHLQHIATKKSHGYFQVHPYRTGGEGFKEGLHKQLHKQGLKNTSGDNELRDVITKHQHSQYGIKEEVEIAEALSAADRFKHHHDTAKALLKSIGDHLKTEHENAMKSKDYKGNKGPNWGHVGSMEHISNSLGQIHDMLARKGEYAEAVEATEETIVEFTAEELAFFEEQGLELDEARRGRPPKNAAPTQDEEPAALGYQLRKAASINKPVHFMNGEKKEVAPGHINAFNDHMAARKTAADKAAFQKRAHKSHADFVKAVSEKVPSASKDTGEIVKYR